jgi:DNA-binding IscR family transcriptional regulator
MPAPCRSAEHCERAPTCATRPLWEKAADLLDQLFTGTTIADLLQNDPDKHLGAAAPIP